MSLVIIVQETGEGIIFDLTVAENYGTSVETTEFPIEDGSVVSDHAQVRPSPFSVIAIVADTVVGPDGVASTVEFIDDNLGKLIDVTTLEKGTIRNCIMQHSVHSNTNRGHKEFNMEFLPLSIAESRDVTLPARQARSATPSGEADIGEQGTEDTSASPAQENSDRSALKALRAGEVLETFNSIASTFGF